MGTLTNFARQFEGLSGLPVSRQISLLILIAVTLAAISVAVLWGRAPSYQTFHVPASDRQASAVAQALTRAGIPYRLESLTGAIQVPATRLRDARMQLASEGVGGAGSTGFEMLADQGFGSSQFIEQARYQKAIEGELERSINAMAGISRSRVHLAIPKQSSFVRDRRPPSASVLITPLPGRVLSDGVSLAIAQLVAASVPEMSPDRVTVVDHLGRLLTGRGDSADFALTDAQLRYRERLEGMLVERIETILRPIVGIDGVRAQVSADLDFTKAEETRETYEPDSRAIRSQQRELVRRQGDGGGSGIPGALSNQPPLAGSAPEVAGGGDPAAVAQADPRTVTDNSVVNYELGHVLSRVSRPTGTVNRLSVAVLLDYMPPQYAASRGTPSEQAPPENQESAAGKVPLTQEDLARIQQLVREAVGVDDGRGDTLSITNIPFTTPQLPEVAPTPVWEQPWLPGLVKVAIAGLAVILLIIMVLRPVSRTLVTVAPAPRALPAGATSGDAATAAATAAGAGSHGQAAAVAPGVPALPGPEQQAQQMNFVKDLARDDPKKVSQVVKAWVADEAAAG